MRQCKARAQSDGSYRCDRCHVQWDRGDDRPECATDRQLALRAADVKQCTRCGQHGHFAHNCPIWRDGND